MTVTGIFRAKARAPIACYAWPPIFNTPIKKQQIMMESREKRLIHCGPFGRGADKGVHLLLGDIRSLLQIFKGT